MSCVSAEATLCMTVCIATAYPIPSQRARRQERYVSHDHTSPLPSFEWVLSLRLSRPRSRTALDADVGTGNEHGLVSVFPADLEPRCSSSPRTSTIFPRRSDWPTFSDGALIVSPGFAAILPYLLRRTCVLFGGRPQVSRWQQSQAYRYGVGALRALCPSASRRQRCCTNR